MELSDLLKKYNLTYQILDQIIDDLGRVADFDGTDLVLQLRAAKKKEDQEDAQAKTNSQNFVTRLYPSQVQEVAELLLEPKEMIGSIAYYFEPEHMVLDIAKYIIVKGEKRLKVDRYDIYDLFIYGDPILGYGELAPIGMQQKYHKLMYNYFGENYLKKTIED